MFTPVGISNITQRGGISKEEFEEALWSTTEAFEFFYEDEVMQEMVYEAARFYYSPWPHLDDEAANLNQIGMVCQHTREELPDK